MDKPGELNVEIAQQLGEPAIHALTHHSQLEKFLEILEAVVLAMVAVGTAWSGYQAARWDGHQSELYGQSIQLNTRSSGLMTLAGQERIYDTVTFNTWLNAVSNGRSAEARLIEKRFRDEYRVAFVRWIQTDPLNNPKAPPGPIFMAEYRNAKAEQAGNLASQASALFNEGTEAHHHADRYVRITVFLATILLFIAISQRFRVRSVRVSLAIIASALLLVGLCNIFVLPRI